MTITPSSASGAKPARPPVPRRPAPTRPSPAPATLGTRVYDTLRDRLIQGDFAVGERLSIRRLADGLGVSMQPVRDAVARLVADEALEVTPKRSVRVPSMSRERFEELTAIRIAIEGFAVSMAAGRRSAAELATLRCHEKAFRAECRAREPDLDRAMRANQALHFEAYRAAGMPTLMPIIAGLWLRIGPVLNLDLRGNPARLRRGEAVQSHAMMVAGIAAGDGAAARAGCEQDIALAAASILSRGVLAESAGIAGTVQPAPQPALRSAPQPASRSVRPQRIRRTDGT